LAFFDENADGFWTPSETLLVKCGDDSFDISLAFAEDDLFGRRFWSAGRLCAS
jgi:hypothetical protein